MRFWFPLCLLVFLSGIVHGQEPIPESLIRILDEHEKIVDRLAKKVVKLFEKRATYLENCTCSRHSCSNDVYDFNCTKELGNDTKFCGECVGRYIGFEASAFRTPPNTNIKTLTPRLKESICLYANLEKTMKKLLKDQVPTWIYFGGVDGSMRIYPASSRTRGLKNGDEMLGGCDPYEPRTRPWFVGTSTRPKDIVFVIDVSTSMNSLADRTSKKTRWDVTKRALMSMLDTLAHFDNINIVTFSDTAERLEKSKPLVSGTEDNRKTFKKLMEGIKPSGGTNFDAGFAEAFDILTSACEEETQNDTCTGCHKVIMFLTEGRDTSQARGESIKPSTMLAKIDGYQNKLAKKSSIKANIFTFSMGEKADDSIPKQIACANNGSWSYIGPKTNTLTAMNNYYHFLTDSSTNNTTTWFHPYEDFGGLGNVTTVTKPVFSRGKNEFDRMFLGVAAHDVMLSEIENNKVSHQNVLDEIVRRFPGCGNTPQNPCQLQLQREAYLNTAVCADPITSTKTTSDYESDSNSPCYRGSRKLYKFFATPTSWERAKKLCRRDQGRLAVIENNKQLAFVAGLSSPDGSWIGAKRNLSTFEMEWIDDKVSSNNLEDSSPYWGFGEPNNYRGKEDCVHIDRRGTTGNLNDARCETELSFVCEYDRNSTCVETEVVPEKGYFNIPPPTSCVTEKDALDRGKPHNRTEKLSVEEVMCPLGEPKGNFEVKCCSNCTKEN
eukprot:g7071.t1